MYIHASNIWAPKYIKQVLRSHELNILINENCTFSKGHIIQTKRQQREIELKLHPTQMDPTDTYKSFHQTVSEQTSLPLKYLYFKVSTQCAKYPYDIFKQNMFLCFSLPPICHILPAIHVSPFLSGYRPRSMRDYWTGHQTSLKKLLKLKPYQVRLERRFSG